MRYLLLWWTTARVTFRITYNDESRRGAGLGLFMTDNEWQRLIATAIVCSIPAIRSSMRQRAEKARHEGRKPIGYRIGHWLGKRWPIHH